MIILSNQNLQNGFPIFLGVYFFLVIVGMLLNGWNNKRKTIDAKKGKASIPEKFLVFVVFQLILFTSSYFANASVHFLMGLFSLLIIIEIVINREYIVRVSGSQKLLNVLFFMTHLTSLLTWSLLHVKLGTGILLPMIFLLIAVNDSFAQIMGEIFQGPKMAVHLSPNKTWSGFIGSGIWTIITAWVLYIFFPQTSLSTLILLAIMVWLCGTAGDLWASWIKRKLNISDFSNFMGASGGILDRIDSFVLIPILLYIFFQLN